MTNRGSFISHNSGRPHSGSGFSGVSETPPTSNSAEFQGGTIADQVRNSQAYKTAYTLFSSLADKSWLNRLMAIPTSVQDAPSTWFDEHGLSNKYKDKQNANYQYCIQQIQNLLSEYYAWKNSLPISQVDQYQDAGINSAITGQGVTASEMNPQMLSSDPSQIQSTDPLSCIQSFVGAMTSVGGGILNFLNAGVNAYGNIAKIMREGDQQIFDTLLRLEEKGLLNTADFGTYDEDGNFKPHRKLNIRKLVGSIGTNEEIDRETKRYKSLSDNSKSYLSMDYYGAIGDMFTANEELMADITNLQYSVAKSQYEFTEKHNAYQRDYFANLNPGNMADYDEKTAKYNAEMSELRYNQESKFRDMYWEVVDKWKKKADDGSILHQQMLNTLLTGYNPFSFGYNAVMTPVKDIMGLGAQSAKMATGTNTL